MRRPSEKTRLLIVIPAWNEEAVLGDVLEAVKAEKPSFADILVVSDGSVDATASIARAAGVAVLDLPLNLGVGGAMRAGTPGGPAISTRVSSMPMGSTIRGR